MGHGENGDDSKKEVIWSRGENGDDSMGEIIWSRGRKEWLT